MSFDTDLEDMMYRTITIEPFSATSTDGYGTVSYSTTSYNFKAYIERKVRTIKDSVGKEVVSTTACYCPPYDSSTGKTDYRVTVSDRITLPTGYTPTTPPIINVLQLDDDEGRHGQVIYL